MPTRFELHGIAFSGPTYKVALMLSLAGEPFDYVHVNLPGGEHKQPDYMARQRYGQVPLLVDRNSGRQLCQSAAILEYLADMTGKLGGADLDERLRMREWLYWDFDRLAPAIYRPRAIRRGVRKGGPEILDMYAAESAAALQVLDRHLAGRTWLVGEAASFADVDVYGVVAYAGEAGIDLAPYANVIAWSKRIEALPGFIGHEGGLPLESRTAA